MMIFFNLIRKYHIEEIIIIIGIILVFQLEYTDDDFCGGRIQDIIRYFREEIRLGTKFALKYDLSQYIAYLLSRDHFRRDRIPGIWDSDSDGLRYADIENADIRAIDIHE